MDALAKVALVSLITVGAFQNSFATGDPATPDAGGAGTPGLLAPLLDHIGTYSRPISGCSAAVQPFFDQGLRLTYGYYLPEALASFREAARLDPDCPMAYWGAAFAIRPIPNSRYNGYPDDPKKEGLKAIRRAKDLATNASRRDRDLIEALGKLYDDTEPDRRKRDRAYTAAMKEVLDRYPDDPEAGTLYAGSLMVMSPWDYFWPDGAPRSGTSEAIAALEHVMEIRPDHPGAPHYYIHIVENSLTPEIALPHADRLEALMPGAGHIVHMPSHIYIRTGLYTKAVESNKRSLVADAAVVEAWGDRPLPIGVTTYPLSSILHPVHAHDFLHMAAVWQGNYRDAMESARTIAEMVRTKLEGSGSSQRRFVRPLLTARRFGKWQSVLKMQPPGTDLPFVEGIWHFVRGSAFAATGQPEAAEKELEQVRSNAARDGMDALRARASTARKLLTLAAHVLAGEIAAERGEIEAALSHLETAVRLEDGLRYVEPPDWGDPVRHVLGDVLMDAGRLEEAEVVYWAALRRYPNNGWSLHGLWKSLLAQGKADRAAAVEKRFRKAWAGSDIDLATSRP